MNDYIETSRNIFCFPDGKIVIKRGDDNASDYLQECRNNGYCLIKRSENFKNEYIYELC